MFLRRQGGATCVVGARGPFSCMFRNELFFLYATDLTKSGMLRRASHKLKNVCVLIGHDAWSVISWQSV